MNQQIEGLSQVFHRFGEVECRGSSRLYERISYSVANDSKMLELAANARSGQPVPNLFFAAVHSLLLDGVQHELAAFYESLTDTPNVNEDPFPALRDFCLTHRHEIENLLRTKLVQTNVVERCSNLLPAFGMVARRSEESASRGEVSAISLIEVGASAGLNLFWDRYGYDYGAGLTAGGPDAPVQLSITPIGDKVPPVPDEFPEICKRIGLDINPIDASDDDAVKWLRALIWPEHKKRVENLYGAIEVVRQDPPTMIEGDAIETLPKALNEAPNDSTPCVFHTHTLNQFSHEARQKFYGLIETASKNRCVYVISIEGISGAGSSLELNEYIGGERRTTRLASCDPHGRWIEWLDADSAG